MIFPDQPISELIRFSHDLLIYLILAKSFLNESFSHFF